MALGRPPNLVNILEYSGLSNRTANSHIHTIMCLLLAHSENYKPGNVEMTDLLKEIYNLVAVTSAFFPLTENESAIIFSFFLVNSIDMPKL